MIAIAVTVIEGRLGMDEIQIIGSGGWIIVTEELVSPFILSMNLPVVKTGPGQDQGKSAFRFVSTG